MSPVPLSQLAAGHGSLTGPGLSVTGITAASSAVRPGDLFVGLPGSATHGAGFATAAVAAGAVAVLTDAAGRGSVPDGVPVIEVADVRAVLGEVSAQVYGAPASRLRMLGVTGTSGKTTTAYFLRAGLRSAGRESGLIGTVATLLGDTPIETGFTTPEAPDIHALLALMAERGVTDVAMEVSSHALAMHRVAGITFSVGAFTNLSEDHLDFHADMCDYFEAKARLFDQSRHSVVVTDDDWGRRLADRVRPSATVATTGGGAAASDRAAAGREAERASWWADEVAPQPDGSIRFVLHGPGLRLGARVAIPGRFNVTNAVLAAAILAEVGVDPQLAVPAIGTATVPGRMEPVDAGQHFLAVVDYSHKPAAVELALSALRARTPGRLIIVLGCGGDRDRRKRPQMGAIAARGADLLIVTDDNPRSEDPATIRGAMLEGVATVPIRDRGEVVEVPGRGEAIAAAVAAAGEGDTVLVAGKGHESGQEIAGVVHPFDDRSALRDAIETLR